MAVKDLQPSHLHKETEFFTLLHTDNMGGCQNCGPFLGTLNIRCRTIIGVQKRTIILTTTHIATLQCKFPSLTESPERSSPEHRANGQEAPACE